MPYADPAERKKYFRRYYEKHRIEIIDRSKAFHIKNRAKRLAAFRNRKIGATERCYGDAIWNPGGGTISAALMVHEEVHSKRQGDDPAAWWRFYIDSPQFRFDEELPAHIAEYQWFAGAGRGERRMRLRQIAQRLASPLYGRLITVHAAKRLISGKDNPDV